MILNNDKLEEMYKLVNKRLGKKNAELYSNSGVLKDEFYKSELRDFYAREMAISSWREDTFVTVDNKKKQKKIDQQGDVKQKNKFFYGLVLAALNVFPIPFYVFLSATLISHDINIFGQPNSSIFTSGVVIGSMLIFYLYIKFFSSKSEDNSFILKNINYVIGGITSVISLLTIYEILK